MRRMVVGVLVAFMAVVGCASSPEPASPAASTTPPAAPTSAAEDPYEVYLRTAPAGAPSLSREDAQTRALLGCGQQWAPGTVDAALAAAYAELCKDK